MAERHVREGDPYQREYWLPVTLRERIAYALCAHDNSGEEHRLTDEEFEGLSIVLRKVRKLAGTDREPASLRHTLDVPASTVRRYYWPLLWLWRFERDARDPGTQSGEALMRMHFVAADWPSYLPAAGAALGVLSESPDALAAQIAELGLRPEPGEADRAD